MGVQLKKYQSHKASGVEWLGNIPANWKVKRIKDIAATTSGTTPTSGNHLYYENGEFNWIRTTDLNNGKLFDTEHKVTPLALQECRLQFLPVDSVLVAMYGGWGTIGKNALVKKASTINQSICAVLPNPRKFYSLYLQYFLHYFRDAWKLFADGARKDPNINQDAVKNLFVIQPPLAEQLLIADYLDKQTAAIDRKVSLLEQKIKLYQTLRKTLINETVCRGLNPHAPRKDSGIEWIGQIPAHWEVKRLKDVAALNQKSLPESTPAGYTFRYIDISNVGRSGLEAEAEVVEFQASPSRARRIVRKHDVIISTVRTYLKAVAYFDYEPTNTIVSTGFAVLTPTGVVPGYLAYQIKSDQFVDDVARFSAGVSYPAINASSIAALHFICPPLAEQTEIAAHLDAKTQQMDKVITNLTTQIATLKELRKTLINDVVTGKLNVTE
jgi:type I restriction enzyme S subunit